MLGLMVIRLARGRGTPDEWVLSEMQPSGRLDEIERIAPGCYPHIALCDVLRSGLERGEQSFVLDLEHLEKVDSSGLGEIVSAHREAVAEGGSVALVLRSEVHRLFDMVGLGELPGLCHTFDEGLDYLVRGESLLGGA